MTKKKKYNKGDRKIYENVFDGLSFYLTVGEIYHLNRSKTKVHKFFSEAILGIASPKVLDIGCYIGTDLFMLPKSNPNARYWGIDVSSDAINYANHLSKTRGEKNIIFKRVDANKKLPFPDNYFDVVLAMELIEHLHNPQDFLKEVRRVIKPGGYLIITTPNEERIPNKILSLLPSSLKSLVAKTRELDFLRHGPTFHINSDDWDNEAHISLWGYSRWQKVFKQSRFTLEKTDGSSMYGGSRLVGDRPFLLGLVILLDSVVDKLPFKPQFQMCMVLKLKKEL